VDVALVIRERLEHLGLEQKDLARVAHVTESYISQILTRRKAPPAPDRTDIYDKLDRALRLPAGELARLAELQRREELKRELGDERTPLLGAVRELVLRKCASARATVVRAIFEREPLGELERLVTQKILDVAKQVVIRERDNPIWLPTMARLGGRPDDAMRVSVRAFLDSDIYHVSADICVSFLNPLLQSWDLDLATLALDIVLDRRVATPHVVRFEYADRTADVAPAERGLTEFLHEPGLSATATSEDLAFLKRLRFPGPRRPSALYYYREMQSLRDPLHFRAAAE
jgi:transcriptional regulator with XRE-family HTH domain